MAKARKKIEPQEVYIAPADNKYWFYIGDKYYKRLQPIPYTYKLNLKQWKKLKKKE